MKLVTLGIFFVAIIGLDLSSGQESSTPAPPYTGGESHFRTTMQVITYCCGNHPDKEHPDGPHCGPREAIPEFEKKFHCKNWKVEPLAE
jgi:hypothetical protein